MIMSSRFHCYNPSPAIYFSGFLAKCLLEDLILKSISILITQHARSMGVDFAYIYFVFVETLSRLYINYRIASLLLIACMYSSRVLKVNVVTIYI